MTLLLAALIAWTAQVTLLFAAVWAISGSAVVAAHRRWIAVWGLLAATGTVLGPAYAADPWVLLPVLAAAVVLRVELRVVEASRSTSAALARTDGLTGLLNHGAFYAALDALADRGPVAVVLLDLDHFKTLNDTAGHAAGDAALRSIGGMLRSALPSGGLAARYGGDEFALAASSMSAADAKQLALSLRKRIERDLPPLTASCGATAGGGTATALVAAADRALYAAKRRGRNRVRSAPLLGESLPVDPLPAQLARPTSRTVTRR